MRLVPIGRSGEPEDASIAMSDIAKDVCAGTAILYRTVGFVPPWIGYLAVEGGEFAGTCAFKAPPTDGRVEIAYFTFPPHENRGIATRMARELVAIAQASAPGVRIVAQTLPERGASTSILRQLGFRPMGPVEHPEDGTVWEWHLQAPDD